MTWNANAFVFLSTVSGRGLERLNFNGRNGTANQRLRDAFAKIGHVVASPVQVFFHVPAATYNRAFRIPNGRDKL